MSFDNDTRNLLARTVTACRRRLTKDVADQLRGVYGLHPDGTVLPLDKLTHLSPDQTAAARRLRDLLDHYTAAASGKDEERRAAAYERMVLEISFTFLNRLAALRLCEERGLVVECVRRGTASDGFQLFERVSGGALGARYDAYRVFIECLFDELALDLGVLFDRLTPQSSVFPTERCMEDVLAELNKSELTSLWTEDETIGWIYQYFNPPQERKAMREASQAPRNSRELAVRNQFFTPRYVVEFLTDNSLGRIWFEMRKGGTALKEECRYLVRRPNEVFLAPGETGPADQEDGPDLSQEELLKRPVYIADRPKKDPRDLRVLDPACGSGHFLLYAFDLLERIYEEAWQDADSPKSEASGHALREEFETLDDLRRAVPKLIIEYNLHGIDIDPRAVQIAALALWLRAQKGWANLSLKAVDRPRIDRSNIVTAEPMPGEEDLRREFTSALKPRVLGQLVEVVFEKMKLAGEAGSLLKIEEEIRDAVAEARTQWLEAPKPEQQFLFPGMADVGPKQEELRFDFAGVTEEGFWEQAEDRILEALKDYAEQAENGFAIRRRLFADDAARGFAFIDVCRKRYDIVLMNPPFGEVSGVLAAHIESKFPCWNRNVLCAFIEQQLFNLTEGGFVASVLDRSLLNKSTYEPFRKNVLLQRQRLSNILDLGWNVLDANVEVSSCILKGSREKNSITFCHDVRDIPSDEKNSALIEVLSRDKSAHRRAFAHSTRTFDAFPNHALVYDLPDSLLTTFTRFQGLKALGLSSFTGHQLESFRHFMFFWELDPTTNLSPTSNFSHLYNGGEFSRFAVVPQDVVRFGYFSRLKPEDVCSYTFVLRNQNKHFLPGIGFGVRGEFLDAHVLAPGQVFTVEGQSLPISDRNTAFALLGILNSAVACRLLNAYSGQHKYSGYVNLLPCPDLSKKEANKISQLVEDAANIKREAFTSDETSLLFISPSFRYAKWKSIYEASIARHQEITEKNDHLRKLFEKINVLVCSLFRLTDADAIEDISTYSTRMPEEKLPFFSASSIDDVARHVCSDVVSYSLGCIYGRWDVRIELQPSLAPKVPKPFDPLPIRPLGMLVGLDGLPAKPDGIVSEEWLHSRTDASILPLEDSIKSSVIQDDRYLLQVDWDGILVDDPGFYDVQPHRDDVIGRLREVFDLLWKDRAHEIEQEASEILGVSDLRDYFRRPSGFFQDHLKRYSKPRRKAPIYWPLSTKSSSYTIWLYYPRLSDQTLYAAVNRYVEPKIAEIERVLAGIEEEFKAASGREATRLTDRLNEARAFLSEVQEMRQEMLRIAALPYRPNLNDGVIINAAPFHNLFRLRSWAKDTGDCWKKLQKGDYDWAHLAYTIWPERVREVCRKDRSIAIAHGLEDLCVVTTQTSNKRGRRRSRKQEAAG